MATLARQCKARAQNGRRCEGFAVTGSLYCLTHDPNHATARNARNRKGGRKHAVPKLLNEWTRKIESIGDLLDLLNLIIADTVAQENTAARSRALLAAIETGIKCLAQNELADRVAAIEAVLQNREVKR